MRGMSPDFQINWIGGGGVCGKGGGSVNGTTDLEYHLAPIGARVDGQEKGTLVAWGFIRIDDTTIPDKC